VSCGDSPEHVAPPDAASVTSHSLVPDAAPGETRVVAADAASAAPASKPDAGVSANPVTAPVSDAGTEVDAAPQAATSDEYLGLAAPRAGFRMKTRGAPIPTGSDTEICEVAELPGAPDQEYIVGSVDLANARSSHHLIISLAQPGSAADKKLRSLPVGSQTPCVSAQIEFGEGLTSVAGAQTQRSKYDLPPGVGLRMRGGQRVVFDYHYFNYSGATLMAESAAAFHTLAPGEVKNVANGFSFTNMTLDTQPHDKGTFTAECQFKQDIMLLTLARHTHTSGTDFTVWFEGGAKHGQQIWQSLDWEHDTQFDFPEPIRVKAGEGFKFACSFRNDTSKPLRFGIRASDEMCILSGAIWSPTPGAELPTEACVITWVDAQGIGHDARDEGGFPAPSSDEVLACSLDTVGIGFLDDCVGCICDSCGAPFTRCNADPDCKAILECRSACQGQTGTACEESCESVMFEHSSGVGMAAQVGECLLTKCGSRCAISTGNAGR
jgi:hypothetical protein